MSIGSPQHTDKSEITSDMEDPGSDPAVLVPVFDALPPRSVLDTAVGLAEATSMEVLLMKTVKVADQTPLELTDALLKEHREQLANALAAVPETESAVDGVTRIGHTYEAILVTGANDHIIPTLVMEELEFSGRLSYWPFRAPLAERVGVYTNCDIVVGNQASDYGDVASILVPVAGGPHSGRAVDVACVLAAYHDAWIEFLHVIETDASNDQREEAHQYLETAVDRVDGNENYDTWLLEADDVATEIIEQSIYYDMTIIGAPTKGRLKQFVFGSTTADIQAEADCTVMTVRRHTNQSWMQKWLVG
ncbi:universal stress protein [Saliphagus sp. LR7]|uniref:universal stress protein n=1 Tax=Saliphagus sp. LR7 TaxID=2282654 RepID=UPI000DF78388|nr:universal stress protein [Saliphagus sp. LR7]